MIEIKDNNNNNNYDDGNIPEIDCPPVNKTTPTEPKPECERPRKDGPGGD